MNNLNNGLMLSDNFTNENPKHLKYINEFRIKQCTRFQAHKCAFHKPFNCFDWHFPNQRRRIPFLKEDRTFNYNPDLYCNDYDLNTGLCSNGNICQYVHLNAGDTERRYHPRYYKTGMCIYETTIDGVCGINGIHCAFAHEQNDLRKPILDIRESLNCSNNLSAQLEKERVLSEDPIWNQMDYVLAFYKTKECKKLPKTCRQGYACPFYHNSKDKRRVFDVFQYQSQPCTFLKPNNDDWQDIAFCQLQDNCKFSHSRTEQQFHPEIFKSSKCNDMIRDGYCPRGPFCAFAHNDEEMNNGQYNNLLQACILKHPQMSNSDLTINFHTFTQCLNDTRSQMIKVFQNDQKSQFTSEKQERPLFTKLCLPSKNNWDILNSSFSEGQCKDISINIKQILERALSDSSNVSQMTDLEIQRLPELLMKFSNGDNPLNDAVLPNVSEWIDQDKTDDSFDQIFNRDNRQQESTNLEPSLSQEASAVKKVFSDRTEKILLYKEILDTKNKLKRAEEDLKVTQNQIESIIVQIQEFVSWLSSLEICDTFKKEMIAEISVILEKLGKIDKFKTSCGN